MEEVDAFRLELLERFVKAGSDQGRETLVIGSIVGGNLCEGCIIITTCMLIATPCINPETPGARLVFNRRLAEGEKALTAIDPQLYHHPGLKRCHEVVPEMEMRRPRANIINARLKSARRKV